MVQIAIIAAVLIIFLFYFTRKKKEQKPKDELDLRCKFYKEETMNFIRKVKLFRSKTRLKRLETEIERFHKIMQLDEILEKTERESNPAKAIDYYLEALSFILKNKFEPERKAEIEEKIKILQEGAKSKAYK